MNILRMESSSWQIGNEDQKAFLLGRLDKHMKEVLAAENRIQLLPFAAVLDEGDEPPAPQIHEILPLKLLNPSMPPKDSDFIEPYVRNAAGTLVINTGYIRAPYRLHFYSTKGFDQIQFTITNEELSGEGRAQVIRELKYDLPDFAPVWVKCLPILKQATA